MGALAYVNAQSFDVADDVTFPDDFEPRDPVEPEVPEVVEQETVDPEV